MAFRIEYIGKIIGLNQRSNGSTLKSNTEEYNNFKEYIGWLCKKQNRNEPMIEGRVEIILFYNSELDIDNLQKGILDGLQGIAYTNDNKIKKERVEECKQIKKGFILWVNSLPDNAGPDSDPISSDITT